ncbi:MAG: hypothetical protein ACJZ9F_01705 [Rhodospirillaceae bacterium]
MSDGIRITPVNRGKRPTFFDDPAIDQLMAIIMAMSAEMSVVYDRVDTIERLLDKKGTLSRADVEAYRPDEAVEDERNERRNEYIARLFRIIREERDTLTSHDKMDEYNTLMDELARE